MRPILKEKSVFNREKQRRLGRAFDLLQEAGIVVSLALAGVLLCITLLSVFQNKTVPWLPLLGSLDELAFLAGSLMLPCILRTLINYHGWRFMLFTWRALGRHLCRSGQRPPAADALVSMLSTWQQTILQASVTAFLLQLRNRLTRRPPTCWSSGKAPLGLFQRANLLLAP
ncbi:MAG: hypothetical protein H6655_12525 [Ardenticatenaceae bacterium]|nr:hypothetical protein [Ardenticatenaceae bacterium]